MMMFLIGHGTVGAAIGELTANPMIAILFGFASHFLGDAIPHGDETIGSWAKANKFVQRMILVASIDLTLLSLILFTWQHIGLFSHDFAAVSGAFGSILPDVLWGMNEATKGKHKTLRAFTAFHHRMHVDQSHLRIPFPIGVLMHIFIIYFVYIFLR